MSALEGLVREWAAQGVLDSQGRFTLRADRAISKLRRSQLGDPHAYALAFFRAIVISGARRVEMRWDLDDLWWKFDGPGLPAVEELSLSEVDLGRRYLITGLLGALSHEPSFLRYRGPAGGWEISSVEQPVKQLPTLFGTPQLQLRRRMGKTLLWSLGRHFLREKRELESTRQRCASAEVELRFRSRRVEQPLKLESAWEIRFAGALGLALSEPARPLTLLDEPPFPLHAVFAPHEGASAITFVISGVRLDPLPLPWPDCQIVVSTEALGLDLSQQSVVQDDALKALLKWLRKGWLEILRGLVHEPRWYGLLAREILRPKSRLREEMSDIPLFQGRSLRSLTQSTLPVGLFPLEQETALVSLGAKLVNQDLANVLRERPGLRGPILQALFRRHGLNWALPKVVDLLPASTSRSLISRMTQVPHTLRWDPRAEREDLRLSTFAREVLQTLESLPELPDPPFLLITAYLEAAFLLPEGETELARSHLLSEAEVAPGVTLRRLFEHFLKRGHLSMRATEYGSCDFVVPREIGQRIAVGLLDKGVTWNGQFCHNPLAADDFLLLSHLESYLPVTMAGFSTLRREGSHLQVPLYPEGMLEIDTARRKVWGTVNGDSFDFSGKLYALKSSRTEVAGDDKTHVYCSLAFSDGLRNTLLRERGKRYDSVLYSDSDADEEVTRGWQEVVSALTELRELKASEPRR